MVEGISGRDFSEAEPLERFDDDERTIARGRVAPEPPNTGPTTENRAPAPAAPRPPAAHAEPPIPTSPRAKRRLLRPLLFAALPVVLVIGGYDYVTGGRVMSTDNAYVQARSLGVSTDVSGTVAAIEVRDNQHVEKGQPLFRLTSNSFRIALEGAQAQLGTVRNQVLTLQASYKQSLSQIAQAKAARPPTREQVTGKTGIL